MRSPALSKLALSALVTAAIIGGIFATLRWATGHADSEALQRQTKLVELVVSKLQVGIAHDQESATVWDDAVRKVAERDRAWMDSNLGSWMHTYFGHDGAFVLTAEGELLYSHMPETPDGRAAFQSLLKEARAIASALQRRLAQGDETGISDRTLSIGETELTVIGGRPAVLSAKPIVSDTGDIEQEPGTEAIHIALRYLDGAFAASVGAEYLFDDMRFDWKPAGDERQHYPLVASDGSTLGYFSWLPFKPGTRVLQATEASLMLGAIAVFLLSCAFAMLLQNRSERLKQSQNALLHLALHDPLSGLPNRASFTAEAQKRLASEGSALLFLDLDRFKQVNDTLGHPAGDQLIREVAQRIRAIAGPDAFVARIGGDEFTLITTGMNAEEVGALADRIIGDIRQPFQIGEQPVLIGLTIGIAFSDGGVTSPEDIVRNADLALYNAKAAGRNRYAIFGAHMEGLINARRELERDLVGALAAEKDIEVHFQPVFAADEGRMISVEALARWRHPTKGPVSPDVFIGIAEEAGLIERLGHLVLRKSIGAASAWPGIGLAVNASALELQGEGYTSRVLSILEEFAFDPGRLEIEITESALIDDEGACRRNIAALRAVGVRFALDDFGTGFSSFGRLQDLEVDRIKIDKCFIENFGTPGGHDAIVNAMIGLAHAKGLRVTAEGVETQDQSNRLRQLGCDDLQGYLLSRPVDASAISDILKAGGNVSGEFGAAAVARH